MFVWNVHDGGFEGDVAGSRRSGGGGAWGQSGLATADKNGVAIVWGR